MRGRHTSAMLEMIGIEELIAPSIEDYIDLAATLANSPQESRRLRKKVLSKVDGLFQDESCIEALDDFFKRATGRPKRKQRTVSPTPTNIPTD